MSESLRAYIAALGLDEVWVMNALQEHGKCSDLCVEVEDVGNGGECLGWLLEQDAREYRRVGK